MTALDRIEIQPRGHGDMGSSKHALGKFEAVIAETRHIGIQIKGAIHREHPVETGHGQTGKQGRSILLISVLDCFHFRSAIEGSLGRDLREHGTEIARFPCSLSMARTRQAGTTIHPTRHPVMQKYFEKELITTAVLESLTAVSAGNA